MTEVLAAVHDACDAMSRIASADRRQVRALAAAGQVLVAAGPEPGTLDMLGPLAPARPDRIGALLTLYQYTAQASAEATTTASAAATAARVPHRAVLPAIHAGHRREPVTPEAAEQIADAQSLYEPGRIERTLRGLGVTDIDLLRRGGEIDQAAEQLIIQAAGNANPVYRIHPVQAYACKPSKATIVNQLLPMVGRVWLRALRCRRTQKEQKPNPDGLLSVSRTNLQHPAGVTRRAHDEAHVARGAACRHPVAGHAKLSWT